MRLHGAGRGSRSGRGGDASNAFWQVGSRDEASFFFAISSAWPCQAEMRSLEISCSEDDEGMDEDQYMEEGAESEIDDDADPEDEEPETCVPGVGDFFAA